LNVQYRNDHLVIDEHAFLRFTTQNQHGSLLLSVAWLFVADNEQRTAPQYVGGIAFPVLSVHVDFVDHLSHTADPGHSFLGNLLVVEAG
jgi:hypothetical protein